MDEKDEKEQDICQEDCCCPIEPEDNVLDLSKMSPEEMKDYLNKLFRSRSSGCC